MSETTLSTQEQINKMLERNVEFEEVSYKGQTGYLPLYFNHTFKSSVSQVFAETQEESAEKFLAYLKTVKKGDTNDNNRDQGDVGSN